MTHRNFVLVSSSAEDRVPVTAMLAAAFGPAPQRSDPERAKVVNENIVIGHGKGFSEMIPAIGSSAGGLLFLGAMSDGVALVVDDLRQPAPAICRQLHALRAARATGIVVLVKDDGSNGAPADPSKTTELRDFLSRCGYDPEQTTILTGSVRGPNAAHTGKRLAEAMDQRFRIRPFDSRPGVLFTIEDVFSIKGRGVVVTGMMERGILKPGDKLEVVGDGKRTAVTCRAVEMFTGPMDSARQGDCVGILLDVDKRDVARGLPMSTPGNLSLKNTWEAFVRVLLESEGGSADGLPAEWRGQIVIGRREVPAVVRLADGRQRLAPGQSGTVTVTSDRPEAIEQGFTLILEEPGRIVAIGTVKR